VRDGTEVQAGAKLTEIAPRGRKAVWTGIDNRARAIAAGVLAAVLRHAVPNPMAAPKPYLVKSECE
jgi:hypothetical protein